MGPVPLMVGVEWLLDGRVFRLVRQLSPERCTALDLHFNVEREFAQAELLKHYAAGELVFAATTALPRRPVAPRPPVPDLRDLPPEATQQLQQRWQALEPLTQLGRSPAWADFQRRAAQLQADGSPCSPYTLRRYWQCWQRAGGNRLALLPAFRNCGQRGQRRRQHSFARSPALGHLVDEAIRTVYLTLARRPISAVVRHVFEELQRTNARLPGHQALPIPRRATLARAIARCIGQLDPWEVDRQRWGRRIADRKHAPTSPQRLARRILQRFEIDHTPLKIVVTTDAGPLGQPWLTVLIDYYSRLIVGLCLGFEPPSYGVLMEALRQAILPKTDLQRRYPQVRGTWPCYGLPETLVCDRGADLISKDLEAAAFQLGIELDFAPPRTPHFKGTVEAFFGGLNDQLLASLPGRTFRSWERRADYQPEQGPLLSYDALRQILHVYLVDVYARDKHPTLPCSRLEAWQASAAEHPPFLPASPEELLVLLSRQVQRNLTARGLELGGMFYTSAEILALRPELAAHNLSPEGLTVRYNPWDLGTVWLLDPLRQRYLKATAVDPALHDLTEYQWRVLKKAVRERFDQPSHLLDLAQGRNTIRDVIEQDVQHTKPRRQRRATRFLQQPQRATATALAPASAAPATPGPPAEASLPGTTVHADPADTAADTAGTPEDLDVSDWEVAQTPPRSREERL